MSKKRNQRNTKKSLQQLRAKRKQYAEGGVPKEEEKRIDTIAAKQAKAQKQYEADSRKAAQQYNDTNYKNSGVVTPPINSGGGTKPKTGNEGDKVSTSDIDRNLNELRKINFLCHHSQYI